MRIVHECAKQKKIKRKTDRKTKKSGNFMVLGSPKHIGSEKITKNRSRNFLLQGKKLLTPEISREA